MKRIVLSLTGYTFITVAVTPLLRQDFKNTTLGC